MKTCSDINFAHTRRGFLQQTSAGFGWLALAALNAQRLHAEATPKAYVNPLAPKKTHHAPKAKRVIFLYMQGGPSHMETFDFKPDMVGRPGGPSGKLLGPVLKFEPRGKSGIMISEAFPELAKHADELCLLNGCQTRTPSHQQATVALHTGNEMFVRPSMGAWCVYGLGTEAQDLPGYITIDPPHDQGGAMNYGSAFLPATFQGTRIGSGQRGLPNLDPYLGYDQRKQVDFVQKLNRRLVQKHDPANPELEGLIQSMELACQMQTSVPGVLDLSKESDATQELYGIDNGTTERFGTQCLTARRLAEKGVRFIQITHGGWDHHNNLKENLSSRAESIDKPIAGLITDLKQRDMLKDTLIVWGGEFGRSPSDDKGDGNGRGHNAKGFSMWMAGGGVKGGHVYGATDETGREAVKGIMGTHDVHATILHLLGLDHELLTYRYAGRDFRLTDVAGEVAADIIA